MLDNVRFVEREVALALHQDQIDRYGGDPGIRDAGLLESALAMPRAMFSGQYVHEGLTAMRGPICFTSPRTTPLSMGTSVSPSR